MDQCAGTGADPAYRGRRFDQSIERATAHALHLRAGWTLDENSNPGEAGMPALIADAVIGLKVSMSACISGLLYIDPEVAFTASDSIVDATAADQVAYAATDGESPGGTLTLTAVTVIGKINANIMQLVSNSVLVAELAPNDSWSAAVRAERRQQGCVRFTYLPADLACRRASSANRRFPERHPPPCARQRARACRRPSARGSRRCATACRRIARCSRRPRTPSAEVRTMRGRWGRFTHCYQPQRGDESHHAAR